MSTIREGFDTRLRIAAAIVRSAKPADVHGRHWTDDVAADIEAARAALSTGPDGWRTDGEVVWRGKIVGAQIKGGDTYAHFDCAIPLAVPGEYSLVAHHPAPPANQEGGKR